VFCVVFFFYVMVQFSVLLYSFCVTVLFCVIALFIVNYCSVFSLLCIFDCMNKYRSFTLPPGINPITVNKNLYIYLNLSIWIIFSTCLHITKNNLRVLFQGRVCGATQTLDIMGVLPLRSASSWLQTFSCPFSRYRSAITLPRHSVRNVATYCTSVFHLPRHWHRSALPLVRQFYVTGMNQLKPTDGRGVSPHWDVPTSRQGWRPLLTTGGETRQRRCGGASEFTGSNQS
jgi:hypothetical protein